MLRHLSVRIGTFVFLASLAAGPAAALEVGKASAVNPAATANQRTITIGASIAHKERIVTTAAGSVQLLFVDKTSMTIGPNSDLTIDEYVYDPNAGTGKLAATLGKGALRFVGGQISHSGDAEIRTASAVIGIRGGVALITPQTTFAGYGTVNVGLVGEAGGQVGEMITLRAGEYTQYPPGASTPTPPGPPPAGYVAGLLTGLQSQGGQTGGAVPGAVTPAAVTRAETRATGTNGGAVAGQLTPPVVPQAVVQNGTQSNGLTQTIQTTTQQTAMEEGARPEVTLSGFFVGLVQRSRTDNPSSRATGMIGTTDNPNSATVTLDATGRVQANLAGTVVRATGETSLPGSVAYKFDSSNGDTNYNTFSASAAMGGNGQPLSTVGGSSISNQTAKLVALDGPTLCTCEFTRWGTWSSDSQQSVATAGNTTTYYRDVATGYWVAGRQVSPADMPSSGTATYGGAVIGQINNGGNIYTATGTLTATANFSSFTVAATVSGFDGVDYSGSVSFRGGTSFSGSNSSLSAPGTQGSDRQMTLAGQFYRGATSPAGEMGGTMKVTNHSETYVGYGIFAARMK